MRRLCTFGFALLAACATTQSAPPSSSAPELVEIVEDYFEGWLRLNPFQATFIGDHRFDDQLDDGVRPEHEAATAALIRGSLEEARQIDPEHLSERDRIVLEVFLRELELAEERLGFQERLLPLNQMSSLPSTLAQFGSGEGAQPFQTAADHEAWLRRAAQFPAWVDAAIAALKEGAAKGVTHPRVAMKKLVPQLDALTTADPEQSLFWGPVARTKDLPAADRDRLTTAYRALIAGTLAPAYTRLRDFVRDEYLPACREEVGWSALPNGDAWYRFRIRAMTTTDLSPDEIHRMGLEEVARIRSEMDQVRQAVRFEGDLKAFFAHLREDPKYYFQRPEELLAGYRELKARIDRALPALFSDFPRADYEVREVEAFRAEASPGAEYQAPSADGSRPGVFYVNTFNLKAQPKFGMETLSLHEAAPGHHFQIAIQQELTHLPRFRRFADYAAYSEGWALYAESLGKELGLFQDPLQYFGRLNDEQLRAMRLAVDTGLHAKGWSRQQAVDFMLENSSLAPSDVEAEVDRYIVWAGQALAYKVGQWRIRALRTKAEAALGSKWDPKAFHSAVLRDGAMPLDVLEAKVDRWIAAQATNTN